MRYGALAHLGERELCKLEVTGSSPVCSTEKVDELKMRVILVVVL